MNMKFLCAVLFIVCIVEAYLVLDARKELRILVATQDNFLNLNVLAIRMNMKVASEITANSSNAVEILEKFTCGGNPFPQNFFAISSVREETKYRLKALHEEVTAHCKDSPYKPAEAKK